MELRKADTTLWRTYSKVHSKLKPYIYILSALTFCIIGAYLLVSMIALLQDTAQPSWFIAIFKWWLILLILYWTMYIASLAAHEFNKQKKVK